MCNAIPILSPFFYTIPISLFFEFNFFFFFSSLPSFFMHACIHKVQWIYRRQGDKVSKKLPFCQTMIILVCAKFHDHTYAVLYAHCGVSSHCLRLVAIGYNNVTLP